MSSELASTLIIVLSIALSYFLFNYDMSFLLF